jgi:hypothetical protein
MDLSYNQIETEADLAALADLKALEILNLEGNPMLIDKNWKNCWYGSFSLNLIYEMDNLYVFIQTFRSCRISVIRKISPSPNPHHNPKPP